VTYEVIGDAIDFTYCGTPLADAWKKHGYIGVFFASYIQQPKDMSLEFIGRARAGRGDTNAHWIKHLPPKHGEPRTIVPPAAPGIRRSTTASTSCS
jgi:hypothetical protein